jgi:hypothetical protein
MPIRWAIRLQLNSRWGSGDSAALLRSCGHEVRVSLRRAGHQTQCHSNRR